MLLVRTITATLLYDLMIYCCLAPIQCYYVASSLLLSLFLKEIFELAGWRFYSSKQSNDITCIILELICAFLTGSFFIVVAIVKVLIIVVTLRHNGGDRRQCGRRVGLMTR